MIRAIACVLVLAQQIACTHARDDVELIVDDLGVPWGMAFIDNDRLIVAEKAGAIKIIDIETGNIKNVKGVPDIDVIGQGGLMDIALSPSFSETSEVYITYAKKLVNISSSNGNNEKPVYATALAVARLVDESLQDWQDLFVSNVQSKGGRHFGSRIAFDDKGYVFFTHGDRGVRNDAQDLPNHAGTVMRLHLDGRVPNDNPFVASDDAQPEIWSYGHRNPQGIFYDQATQRLWTNEHGPRGGDEINLIERGGNYGWPILSYGAEYSTGKPVGEATERDGYIQPIKSYVPSIAPSSLIVYTGDVFPEWQGNLISGALVLRHLNLVSLDGEGVEKEELRLLTSLSKRVRNVKQSPGGDIFVTTDAGEVYKLLKHSDQ